MKKYTLINFLMDCVLTGVTGGLRRTMRRLLRGPRYY